MTLTESVRVKRTADFSVNPGPGVSAVAGGDVRDQPCRRCRNRRVAQRENLLPPRDSRLPLSRGGGAQSSDHHSRLRHGRRRAGERYSPAPVLLCRPPRSADLLQGPGMPPRRDDTATSRVPWEASSFVFTSEVPTSAIAQMLEFLAIGGAGRCAYCIGGFHWALSVDPVRVVRGGPGRKPHVLDLWRSC